MQKLYLDCETCGFHGFPVLLQFAHNRDRVQLYDIWTRPVAETLRLVEGFTASTVVGFNLAFDWFHIANRC